MRESSRSSCAVAALAALALLCASTASAADKHFRIVTDLASEAPSNVEVQVLGAPQQPFNRSAPNVMDSTLLEDFHKEFSFMQDIGSDAADWNTFESTSLPYVAAIEKAYVEGENGLVWDVEGNIYHEKNMFFERTTPNPMPTEVTANKIFQATRKEHFPLLATTIQRYGHMYYHFVVETLPKLALLKEAGLPEGTKILMWGESYEQKFLDVLGIPQEMVVKYDPLKVYTADVLYFPTPVPRITPAREALELTREELGAGEALPESERDLIIYCTRKQASTRSVSNEQELLSSLEAAFPDEKVVVYDNIDDVATLVDLFKRAKVIMGPHGAGLSHMLFAAPGTHVLEFQFMRDPPMMFWHLAAALNQDYWLLPVANAWWMQKEMHIPVEEVVDMVAAMLKNEGPGSCPPGTRVLGDGTCETCPAGTYAFNGDSAVCKPCSSGRFAFEEGSAACRTCPVDTYAEGGNMCVKCPLDRISWIPGASSKDQCLTYNEHKALLRDISLNLQMLQKLSPRSRKVTRRALIEATTYGEPNAYVGGQEIPETEQNITAFAGPTEEEIIEACRLKETFSDPYMAPPVLDDIDCSSISAMSKDETGKDVQPSASQPNRAHHPHHFVHDRHCLTGMAIKGTVDHNRGGRGRQPACVSCDLPMLLDITKCNAMDASEECCRAAKAWNNGGCMCAHSSHKLAKEMGASHALMKALANQCDFTTLSEHQGNCPAKAAGHFRSADAANSAAFSAWNTLIPATLGAGFLLMFALFTE
ncbi:hypothetical protein HOP50_02g16890 [Chloropicon primus]|nr:hypothetical protein A3770_02p16930 [Chloropicon primus]UPQ98383.1 hypothetical protein HOP50_02g16890 [Chloropicon primus]|eukprot:QDZ19175.1 hypothetical protein A3770_02p16930 [Chloropicon primus]